MFEAKMPQLGLVISEIKAVVEELAKIPNQPTTIHGAQGEGKWCAPTLGTIRVNCDAPWCKLKKWEV